MGAKQSKRSVDISGKEAESAGEVAAAGAGGEGRVEQIADVDALKPQLNGDAHIHEQNDKEKELDSGTPENEKDATTEKETKENGEEKESAPVTNGDTEPKPENGETATTPDDGKKPKKEKVKKKWSLRSISFSRKDKPKQEKKQKEEEAKTNGEPEKVPEETAEAVPEQAANETAEEAKTPSETKDEKTPETPVTEPLTNGSSTPESPKVETPIAEEPAVVDNSEADKTESKPAIEPEQLPVNGLSLVESKNEAPDVESKPTEVIETKVEEPAAETEVVPVPEIPVKKEVCVEQIPLVEPLPPPLPANPPPSSVASFAATTMAPELTDASLSNTAFTTQDTIFNNEVIHNETNTEIPPPIVSSAEIATSNLTTTPLKECNEELLKDESKIETQAIVQNVCEKNNVEETKEESVECSVMNSVNTTDEKLADAAPLVEENILVVTNELKSDLQNENDSPSTNAHTTTEILPDDANLNKPTEVISEKLNLATSTEEHAENSDLKSTEEKSDDVNAEQLPQEFNVDVKIEENTTEFPDDIEDLPPPPPEDDLVVEKESTVTDKQSDLIDEINIDHNDVLKIGVTNGIDSNIINEKESLNDNVNGINDFNKVVDDINENIDKTENDYAAKENETNIIKNIILNDVEKIQVDNATDAIKDTLGNVVDNIQSNGNEDGLELATPEDCQLPPPPAQESLPLNDKMDLIPEIPIVPELKTDTETSLDVAVAN